MELIGHLPTTRQDLNLALWMWMCSQIKSLTVFVVPPPPGLPNMKLMEVYRVGPIFNPIYVDASS